MVSHILRMNRVDIRLLSLEDGVASSISAEPAICLLFIGHVLSAVLYQLAVLIFAQLDLEPVHCYTRSFAFVGETE